MQKTKVRALISLLGFAGNSLQQSNFAVSSDTPRANYYDTTVKPFSKIQMIELDLIVYQNGSSISTDGFVDWVIFKNPGGNVAAMDPTATTIAMVPYIFRVGRSGVPMQSALGAPFAYHIRGKLMIPPRFQVMAPGDVMTIQFKGTPAGAGISYSVNGQITYMFKV